MALHMIWILNPDCRSGGLDVLTLKNTLLTVCANPQDHVFWDGNHPTTRVKKILADSWTPAITARP